MNTRSTSVTSVPITRRTMLWTGGSLSGLAGMSLAACSPGGENPDQDGDAPDPERPHEAPMLTERVEAGDLPPLEERLPEPEDRLVVQTAEYGEYGGTYNGAVMGPGDEVWIHRIATYEPPLRASGDLSENGLPGTLKSVDVNEDGTQVTLHLRRGLRWSDGEPVTADDVMFAIDDVYRNTDLYSSPPGMLSVEGEACTAEKIDDFTVELTFPAPKGNFVENASRNAGDGGNFFYFPKHYMEQFHPDLNDEAEALADEAGFSDWTAYWQDRAQYYNNPDKPTLDAWTITDPLNQGDVTVLERNPYYWKVDDDGAQLPFIDRLEFEVIGEEEVMLLKALNGEIDFHQRHFTTDANRPVLADARESGDFEFFPIQRLSSNLMSINLNLNHNDEEMREIFQNKDFRIGLSHAIDRQDIIDTVYQRQGQPWQLAPAEGSDYYDEEFALQFTEFDLDLANEHLDAAGLTERDSAGFRLKPSGDRLRFTVDVAPIEPTWPTAMNMIVTTWAEVGVDASVNSIERTLFYDRKAPSANQHDANVWGGDGGRAIEMIETRFWFPTSDESNYATRWASWYATRGTGEFAEEPPEDTRRQMELYWEILAQPDEAEQDRLFREIMQIAKEQFYAIGVVLPGDGYGIVKNTLRNVADGYPDSALHLHPGPTNPSTWFFAQD